MTTKGVYKQGKKWVADATINGQRHRIRVNNEKDAQRIKAKMNNIKKSLSKHVPSK